MRARKLFGLNRKPWCSDRSILLSRVNTSKNWTKFWTNWAIYCIAICTTTHTSVNQARKELFAQKGRPIDLIPSTQAAQHVKRATYQAGYCWSQSCIATPEMPSPSVWGWTKKHTGKWDDFWTDLPDATEACRELLRCVCKKGCCGQCKCLKAAFKCTTLSFCAGNCDTKSVLMCATLNTIAITVSPKPDVLWQDYAV